MHFLNHFPPPKKKQPNHFPPKQKKQPTQVCFFVFFFVSILGPPLKKTHGAPRWCLSSRNGTGGIHGSLPPTTRALGLAFRVAAIGQNLADSHQHGWCHATPRQGGWNGNWSTFNGTDMDISSISIGETKISQNGW